MENPIWKRVPLKQLLQLIRCKILKFYRDYKGKVKTAFLILFYDALKNKVNEQNYSKLKTTLFGYLYSKSNIYVWYTFLLRNRWKGISQSRNPGLHVEKNERFSSMISKLHFSRLCYFLRKYYLLHRTLSEVRELGWILHIHACNISE